jgi:hypothetical protein
MARVTHLAPRLGRCQNRLPPTSSATVRSVLLAKCTSDLLRLDREKPKKPSFPPSAPKTFFCGAEEEDISRCSRLVILHPHDPPKDLGASDDLTYVADLSSVSGESVQHGKR